MAVFGLNVNYQAYDKSQNYFTFGNGGYFNLQNFIPTGFPVNYTMQDERWDAAASFTPEFQSYKEDQSPNAETRWRRQVETLLLPRGGDHQPEFPK